MHLTYPNSNTHTGATLTAKAEEVGAPEMEIEITPEMIEAAIDVFYDLPELLGPSPEQLRDAIKRAFLAMLRMQPKHRHADRTLAPETL